MSDYEICAGIVTYNPDIELLNKNVQRLKEQIGDAIIIDNASENLDEIKKVFSGKIITNSTNLGIAHALNQLMLYAKENGFKWAVSLDQDSILPDDYLQTISEFITLDGVGILCPIVSDRDVGTIDKHVYGRMTEVKECITSAACVNTSAWEEAGGYDEKMFIDSVDFEFCFRVRKVGYKIIRINTLILNHKIGNGVVRRLGPFKVWVKSHSASRKYYIARNMIYLARKHHLYKRLLRSFFRILWLIVLTVLFEDDKNKKVSALWHGMVDGLFMRIEVR